MILINAQDLRQEKLGAFSRYVPLAVPVGVGVLAAYLIEQGHEVKLWDDAIEMITPDDIHELVKGMQKPYIFGISCLTASIARGHTIANQVKELYPDSIMIFGGIHPTVVPEEALDGGGVDFVIRKEGEVPLENLLTALKNGDSYENIGNLTYRKDGEIIHNPPVRSPKVDRLPPFPYHLFDRHIDRYDFGFVVGSRGCPYDCIFCSQRAITGKRFNYRSGEQVVDDIELLVTKYNRTMITFSDDNMLTNKKRIVEMCNIIIERGLHKKTAFDCQVRGDDITEEMLTCLKAANFITLDFGLETASERLMKTVEKGETVEANLKALEMAKAYGFQLSGTFILGLPTETKEDRKAAYKMARKYLDYVRFNAATPYPGTQLYDIAKKENKLNVGKDYENLNAFGTLVQSVFNSKPFPYVPDGTTETDLKKDILKYNLFFSFRWKVITDLLNRKKASSGWFIMVPKWYLSIKEWYFLSQLGFSIIEKWFVLFALIIKSRVEKVISLFSRKDKSVKIAQEVEELEQPKEFKSVKDTNSKLSINIDGIEKLEQTPEKSKI